MRLITRGDIDGIACAVLISKMEKLEAIVFTHPKDLQDGRVEITSEDIIANLPHHPNCALWFDHHISEEDVPRRLPDFRGKFGLAPSAARLVFEYYNDPALDTYTNLLADTDKMDSARLDPEDVTNPKGHILLFYTVDPRTGLGQYQDYFRNLVDWLRDMPIEDVLGIPEVRQRCQRILREQEAFADLLRATSRTEGNIVITDLRGKTGLPVGSRFLIYTLFPDANVSVRIFDGKGKAFTVIAVAHSIFLRSCRTNIGKLLRRYGGGGQSGAGTAQFPNEEAAAKIGEVLAALRESG